MFHRLTVPTYYGGLPVGTDYLNSPADPSVGGSGVPAFADNKKTGGPNDGTYFAAFGEDATSSNLNRGLKALGENTDTLDNLLRRDLAVTVRTADSAAGVGGVSQVIIAGEVFVGSFGTANTQANRDALISVLDANDNEIITSAGTKVQAALLHDGSLNNVIGTLASGFRTTLYVTFNVPVPEGTTYRVYYGERSNLATLPQDAFTSMKIRGAQEVSADVERMLKTLHTSYAGANWNDPWAATINSLARGGLDARYRLSTADNPTTPVLNTPGNGGFILRDGPAVQLIGPSYNLALAGTALAPYADPYLAMLRLHPETEFTATTTLNPQRGGDVGLMQLSPYRSTSDSNEHSSYHVAGPLVFEATYRDIRATTLDGYPVLTKINSTLAATLNPDAGTTTTARRTLAVNAADFLYDGSTRTAIRPGIDMLEVTLTSTGALLGAFRIESLLSNSRLLLEAPTGMDIPVGNSGASDAVTVRWIQPTLMVGGRNNAGVGILPHLFVAQPSGVVSSWDSNKCVLPAAFLSAYGSYQRGSSTESLTLQAFRALGWGSFNQNGNVDYRGYLLGDGGITTSGGRQSFQLIQRNSYQVSTTGGTSIIWILGLFGSFIEVQSSGPAWSGATAFSFSISTAAYEPKAGDSFELCIHIPAGSTGPITMNWGATPLVFSTGDEVLPTDNLTGSTVTVYYHFVYSQALAKWIATRTDY